MHGVSHPAAHAEDRAVEIGARAEVGDGAEEFRAVALFLKRIILGNLAEQL